MMFITMLYSFGCVFLSIAAMIAIVRLFNTLMILIKSVFDFTDDHLRYVPKHAKKPCKAKDLVDALVERKEVKKP